MKSFVAFLALVAVAAADVSHIAKTGEAAAEVVEQVMDVYPDQYKYGYRTSNGITAEESGVLQNAGREDEGIAAQGSYSYTGDDGQVYSVRYNSDLNGFQPEGAHLPKPPPIPDYIIRSLEFIRARNPEKIL